jgi:hypothetical protein
MTRSSIGSAGNYPKAIITHHHDRPLCGQNRHEQSAAVDNRLLEIEHIVAVLGRADANGLQAAMAAHRLGELLELAVLDDLPARVEPVRHDDPRKLNVTQLRRLAGS